MPLTLPNQKVKPKAAARELLVDEFTAIVRAEIGMSEPLARDYASAIVRGLCALHGGGSLYIPASDKSERNAAIRAEFNGTNLAEVCRKHGVARTTLYQIVRRRD